MASADRFLKCLLISVDLLRLYHFWRVIRAVGISGILYAPKIPRNLGFSRFQNLGFPGILDFEIEDFLAILDFEIEDC